MQVRQLHGLMPQLLRATLAMLIMIAPLVLYAQPKPGATLYGRVVNRETGLPVEFANVFLSNTTFGKASDQKGAYAIAGVPAGSYRIIASCVGFEVGVSTLSCVGRESLRVDFALRPRALQQEEIQVEAGDRSTWQALSEEFEEQFIGTGRFSSSCRILNPWVVNLHITEQTQTLWGASDSVLLIENRALGYRLYAVLEKFEYDRTTDALRYLAYPRFELMNAVDAKEQERWQENRLECYRGSCRHFFRALFAGRTDEEGFVVRSGSLQRLLEGEGYTLGPEELKEMVHVASGQYKRLWFSGYLRVDYRRKRNFIRLEDQPLLFDASANFLEPFALTVLTQSAWAQDRIANLVPDDFEVVSDH